MQNLYGTALNAPPPPSPFPSPPNSSFTLSLCYGLGACHAISTKTVCPKILVTALTLLKIAVKVKLYVSLVPLKITSQKMRFSIKDFSSKCDQSFMRIWSHIMEKFFMGNSICLCSESLLWLKYFSIKTGVC